MTASTEDQELGLQVSALCEAGVPEKNIIREKASGKAGGDRPLYAKLLAKLGDGDLLMVWKVDRLGRSTLDALNTAKDLDDRGVHIVITTLGIDLKTPAGRLVFGVMAQIAEFERELIRERVTAGVADAPASAALRWAGAIHCARISGPRPRGCTYRKVRVSAPSLPCSAAAGRWCIVRCKQRERPSRHPAAAAGPRRGLGHSP
jgi:DNA invertase Pin-like site-specific DNA recombinase